MQKGEGAQAGSVQEHSNRPTSAWMKGSGPDRDVALGSRVRLARNIVGTPFPAVAGGAQLEQVLQKVQDAVARSPQLQSLEMISLQSLTPLDRNVLVERHLISPRLAAQPEQRAVALRRDEAVSVMVN